MNCECVQLTMIMMMLNCRANVLQQKGKVKKTTLYFLIRKNWSWCSNYYSLQCQSLFCVSRWHRAPKCFGHDHQLHLWQIKWKLQLFVGIEMKTREIFIDEMKVLYRRYWQWNGNCGKLLVMISPMANSRRLTPWTTRPKTEFYQCYTISTRPNHSSNLL